MPPTVNHLRLVPTIQPAPPVAAQPRARDQDRFVRREPQRARLWRRKPLGQILMDMKAVDPGNMLKALALRERQDSRLGDILVTRGWVSEADLMAALSLQWQTKALDLDAQPPDPRLTDSLGAEFCLAEGIIPWRRLGGAVVLATSRPWEFAGLRDRLPAGVGPVVMALAPERDIHAALVASRQTTLIRKAESRVAADKSCRSQPGGKGSEATLLGLSFLVLAFATFPTVTMAVLTTIACGLLIAATGLKATAFTAEVRAARAAQAPQPIAMPPRLPIVSVMVPLFREKDIVPRLIGRIGRIDYPKELLDIVLVAEDDDTATLTALSRRALPRWMRVVTVPAGPIRTKPRALNYALDFCRGSIIGVWDAEDAPAPDQIHKIVRRFAQAGPETACLQGILDFYNARHNWLTRCFTVEYAAWFRVLLPGLARLGLVVPLGGTTLFFRRKVLESLGGWDAHNVTEDADLGLRLARHGYRTEIVQTVTEEEPNARVISWIRQRSRWQKGFAVTWACHMRDPRKLWRDLGAKRFWGVQFLLFGTLLQAFLAPLLWSFWLKLAGLPHPLDPILPAPAMMALAGVFLVSEVVNLVVNLWVTRGAKHRHLMKWTPSLHLYYPLAALSCYKALFEWVARPFYWDKTSHGVIDGEPVDDAVLPVLLLSDPVHIPARYTAPVISLPQAGRLAATGRLNLSVSARVATPLAPTAVWHAPTRPTAPPAPVMVVGNAPTGTQRVYVLGSTIAAASHRPCIEFQARFEGF